MLKLSPLTFRFYLNIDEDFASTSKYISAASFVHKHHQMTQMFPDII